MRERDIFIEALQKRDPGEVDPYLTATCGGDDALRGRADALLAEHRRQESFILDAPPVGVDATVGLPGGQLVVAEGPGSRVGRYKLLEQIGECGFGVVFLADQQQPVRRKVALKVLKPGMDTKQLVARFEPERQALALIEQPNIAKVLDSGATASGRPYFVMELVRGVPITDYCDANRLTARERLGLFPQYLGRGVVSRLLPLFAVEMLALPFVSTGSTRFGRGVSARR
jgi:eukaryotic-like serine/threonine-protein kinase